MKEKEKSTKNEKSRDNVVEAVPKTGTVFTGVLQMADSKRILLQYQYDEKTNTAKRVQTE